MSLPQDCSRLVFLRYRNLRDSLAPRDRTIRRTFITFVPLPYGFLELRKISAGFLFVLFAVESVPLCERGFKRVWKGVKRDGEASVIVSRENNEAKKAIGGKGRESWCSFFPQMLLRRGQSKFEVSTGTESSLTRVQGEKG